MEADFFLFGNFLEGQQKGYDSNSECNPAEPTDLLQIFFNFCNHLKLPFNTIYHSKDVDSLIGDPKRDPHGTH